MNPKKEFKIASIVLLILGIFDALIIGIEWFVGDFFVLGDNVFLLFVFAGIILIALAKLYMGIMGLKYCKGTGKGTLHITLAKIGVVLALIAVVIAAVNLVGGDGDVQTVLSDSVDAFIMYWYLSLAKKIHQ